MIVRRKRGLRIYLMVVKVTTRKKIQISDTFDMLFLNLAPNSLHADTSVNQVLAMKIY